MKWRVGDTRKAGNETKRKDCCTGYQKWDYSGCPVLAIAPIVKVFIQVIPRFSKNIQRSLFAQAISFIVSEPIIFTQYVQCFNQTKSQGKISAFKGSLILGQLLALHWHLNTLGT